jgi:hypothetical protein
VTLTTHETAKTMSLLPMEAPTLHLNGVGGGRQSQARERYKIPLVDLSGHVVEITAYGLDKITTSMNAVNPSDMHAVFPEAPAGKLQRATEKVEILVGQDNLRLFPVEV